MPHLQYRAHQQHIEHCHDGDGIYYVSVDVNSCLEFLFSLSACFDFPQQQQQQQAPQKKRDRKKGKKMFNQSRRSVRSVVEVSCERAFCLYTSLCF